MTHRGITRRALIVGALALTLLLALPSLAVAIPRDAVLARGKVWVDLNVPYSQSRYATVQGTVLPADSSAPLKGYRTDCSGFVSMSLGLRYDDGRPKSLDTASLPFVLDVIDKDSLAPGDVVLRPKNPSKNITGHAVIFVAWADETRTRFVTYEEGSSKTGTYSRVADYQSLYDAGFRAYRYEAIEDDFADCQQPVNGADRYATAAAASKSAFPDGATAVVLASGENWPDALGGAALSGAVKGPVLLTAKSSIPKAIFSEIKRLDPARVFVLGGPASVDPAVDTELSGLGLSVTRIGGKDRYEAAAAIAKTAVAEARANGTDIDQLYVATGMNFPDALAAAPVSARFSRPVLLTEPGRLTPATAKAIDALDVDRIWVLGGPVSVEETVVARLSEGHAVKRIADSDRYNTAAAIARHSVALGMSWSDCGLASGVVFADALSGGAAQGAAGSVLLLTDPAIIPKGTREEVVRSGGEIDMMRVFGGINTITYPVRQDMADLLRSSL